MSDLHSGSESFDDVEALVRSARDYVQVSRDLRPRVLENARAQRAEQRALSRSWQVAVILALAALFSMSARQRADQTHLSQAAAGNSGRTSASAPAYPDSVWGMVESFTETRRRQAELLRLAL